MICLDDIICEAKCCSAALGAKYAYEFKYGEVKPETKWNFRKLNAFIRTLERNHETIKYKKEKVAITNVDFSALERRNSFLSLRHNTVTVCTKTKISPCLSDSELKHIIEQIKLLCANCKCNCK